VTAESKRARQRNISFRTKITGVNSNTRRADHLRGRVSERVKDDCAVVVAATTAVVVVWIRSLAGKRAVHRGTTVGEKAIGHGMEKRKVIE